jgi:NAD(P)-dependent dehydrogenase (short-subunit alcohol dehydrogenase family)
VISFQPEDMFLVAGASSGIGRGLALRLNELGATVIANGRDAGRLAALREEAARPEKIFLEPLDLAAEVEALPNWVRTLKGKYGKIKGLAYCAGILETRPLRLLEKQSGEDLFRLNYFAAVFLAQGFADRRVNRGPGSAIVFMASLAGLRPSKGQGFYAGSKAALAATAQVMARELAPQGLRVNCLSPAMVKTPMTDNLLAEFGQINDLVSSYPLGLGKVSDVASLAAFLLSDEAGWITGQNYVLDGGLAA